MSKLIWTFVLIFGFAPAFVGLAPAEPGPDYLPEQESPIEFLTRLFAPHMMKAQSKPLPGQGFCGVEIQGMVDEVWSRLTPALRQHIPDHFRPLRLRSSTEKVATGTEVCDVFLDSEHFRIHYSTQPEHIPPGYPDLQTVRDLAAHLETAYAYHRDVSGMGVATPDGEAGGGFNLIDCFFYKIEGGLFGWATGVEPVETECDNSHWGLFSVTTDFGSRDFDNQLRLTSEHEYYHALQYAHNPRQLTWIMESTARNSEFHVWPEIAAPWGAWHWMMHPYYSLWDGTDFHKYAPHFWMYLEAHHGKDFTTRIWDRCCSMRAEIALVDELDALGTDMDAVLPDFAIWNYFTGERDDGEHYDPSYDLPAVYHQAAHRFFPVPPVSISETKIARAAGSNYIRFFGPASDNNLRLTFDGHPDLARQRAVTVLGVNEWGHQAWALEPDQNGDAEMIVPDWGLYDYVTLVVTNFWDAPRDAASLFFTYSAEEVDQAPGAVDSARLVMSSPNPFQNSTRVVFYTPRDGAAATVRVYDISGRLVRTLLDESLFNGLHQVVWDGKDQNGRPAATGIYLVQLESGQHRHTSKVMFVR